MSRDVQRIIAYIAGQQVAVFPNDTVPAVACEKWCSKHQARVLAVTTQQYAAFVTVALPDGGEPCKVEFILAIG